MYKIKSGNKKQFPKNKSLLLGAIVLAVLLMGAYFFVYDKSGQPSMVDVSQQAEEQQINFDPPTEEEITETEQNKEALSENQPSTPEIVNGKKVVTPIITVANRTEIKAYIPGIFEDGGMCMATATKGSDVKTASSTGFADFNKTSCAPIKNLSVSDGGWSVTVRYISSTAEGTSDAHTIQ